MAVETEQVGAGHPGATGEMPAPSVQSGLLLAVLMATNQTEDRFCAGDVQAWAVNILYAFT